MKNNKYVLIVSFCFIFLFPLSLSATSVTLQDGLNGYTGTIDTELNTYNRTTNYGSDTTLNLDIYGRSKDLFKFDVSSIPSGSIINSATFNLYVIVTNNNGGANWLDLYKLNSLWTEGGATWINSQANVSWGVAGMASGVDYASTAETSPNVGYTPTNEWIAFPITNLVQSWVNGSTPNNGFVLSTDGGPRINAASSENGTVSFRPKLTIDYTAPGTTSSTPTPEIGRAHV